MKPELIFPELLEVSARSWLAEQLVSRRAEIIRNALQSSSRDLTPARREAIDTYFVALRALVMRAPESGVAHVAHWGPSFYVLYLLSENLRDDGAEQAASNLFAMLLCESVGEGGSPLAGRRIRMHCNAAGEFHVFSRAAAARVAGLGHPHAVLEWECGAHAAHVHAVGGTAASVEVPLPLSQSGGNIEWRPFERAAGFNIPILDDAWVAVMRPDATAYYSTREPGDGVATEPLLPLRESLGSAYEMLQEFLPEVIPWIALFIPAIVEVPVPPRAERAAQGAVFPGRRSI